MSKQKGRDIAAAVARAKRPDHPELAIGGATQQARPSRPETPQRQASGERRRDRKGRRGIVVYVSDDSHQALRRMALDQRITLQDLCSSAIVDLVDS